MMRNKLSTIASFIFIFLLIASPAYANIIPEAALPTLILFMAGVVLLMSLPIGIINAVIETVISFGILKNRVKNRKSLFKSFLIINLITTPPTMLLAWLILGLVRQQARSFEEFHSSHPEVYLAEIIPFIAEYFLLKWQFKKLFKQGILIEQLSPKTISFVTVTTNLATALLGLLFSLQRINFF